MRAVRQVQTVLFELQAAYSPNSLDRTRYMFDFFSSMRYYILNP